jgi:hypothetical protein
VSFWDERGSQNNKAESSTFWAAQAQRKFTVRAAKNKAEKMGIKSQGDEFAAMKLWVSDKR